MVNRVEKCCNLIATISKMVWLVGAKSVDMNINCDQSVLLDKYPRKQLHDPKVEVCTKVI